MIRSGRKGFFCTIAKQTGDSLIEQHKQFVEELLQTSGLSSPSRLTRKQILHNEKTSSLLKHYGSLNNLITHLYPSVPPRSRDWKSKESRKEFLQKLQTKLNLQSPEDWSQIKAQTFIDHGGRSLLSKYSSKREMLTDLVPGIKWDSTTSRLPRGYWSDISNQRTFLDNLAKTLNLKSLNEWSSVPSSVIKLNGGAQLLNLHSSFRNALQIIYPECNWRISDWKNHGNHFWENTSHQIQFFEELKERLQLNSYEELLLLTQAQLRKYGALSIIRQYGNLLNCLRTLYPNIEWNPFALHSRLPRKFWKHPENLKWFFDLIAKKHNITQFSQWNSVPVSLIHQEGGAGLLTEYPSLHEALKLVYPENAQLLDELDCKKVPQHFWKTLDNQRKAFDHLARELNVRTMDDWNRVRAVDLRKLGYGSILGYYPSFFQALVSVYPEYRWDIFTRAKKPNNFWKQPENLVEFLLLLQDRFKVQNAKDWSRISNSQLKALGGSGLINTYGSLYKALRVAYPEFPDVEKEFSRRGKRSVQRWLFLQLKQIFPDEEIVEDYVHERLTRVSNRTTEFDVFIPSLNLAFEYHGEHHYSDNPAFGSKDLYEQRDQEKLALCKREKVRLVTIPYWWDLQCDSLREAVKSVAPDVLSEIKQCNNE